MAAIEIGAIVVFGSLIFIGLITWILIWRLSKKSLNLR